MESIFRLETLTFLKPTDSRHALLIPERCFSKVGVRPLLFHNMYLAYMLIVGVEGFIVSMK